MVSTFIISGILFVIYLGCKDRKERLGRHFAAND